MGQKQLKQYKRALRKTAQEEKNNIISDYITRNWDQVLVSSVAMICRFNFKNRFQIAMTIIFRPGGIGAAEWRGTSKCSQ